MLAKSIVAAGIRLFGLSIAFIGIRLLLNYFSSGASSSPIAPVSIFIITVALCIFLWRFALALAAILLPAPQSPDVAATAADIESVGFSLLGMYFALSGLNRLVLCLMQYHSLNHPGMNQQSLIAMLTTDALSSAFQFLLGAVLLVGIKPILGFIRRLRTAGLASNG